MDSVEQLSEITHNHMLNQALSSVAALFERDGWSACDSIKAAHELLEPAYKAWSTLMERIEKDSAEIARLRAELAAAREDSAQAKNALMVSEQYRRKYADGKYALYAMGGEFTEAAAKHLPWGSEGPLERYEMRVEREHSPLLVEHNKRLVEMLEAAKEDSARLDWMDLNHRLIEASIGYCGAKSYWCWRDKNDAFTKHKASTLRAAIDAARKGEE